MMRGKNKKAPSQGKLAKLGAIEKNYISIILPKQKFEKRKRAKIYSLCLFIRKDNYWR